MHAATLQQSRSDLHHGMQCGCVDDLANVILSCVARSLLRPGWPRLWSIEPSRSTALPASVKTSPWATFTLGLASFALLMAPMRCIVTQLPSSSWPNIHRPRNELCPSAVLTWVFAHNNHNSPRLVSAAASSLVAYGQRVSEQNRRSAVLGVHGGRPRRCRAVWSQQGQLLCRP